ncbi:MULTISPECIES: NADPH-dependent FMN reductase [Amylolactobacillus]|nr:MULTISPECIES: NADPH-dependent FMN reductase [Amylolactobacillus]APT18744.1 NADPH-dependent FMN reductase [Amylolactobacillus amylophilus DSM 20533 = JCM 1125]GED80661.1 FMN reductase [Amylolactobacillus amylophilus]
MNKFIAIVGSNADKSTNRTLLQFIKRHFADQAEIELVEIKDLPVFAKNSERTIPLYATQLANKIAESDGVIISTPEYDHSVPAALLNALAWLSYGVHPFVNKPVMITGASYGSLGSSRAQAHLRQVLDSPELMARVMPSSEYLLGHSLEAFDDEGNLKDPEKVKLLEGLFADFEAFVRITAQLNNTQTQDEAIANDFSWEENK